MKFNKQTKYALSLGGGGARGAYEIGVWKALKDMGINISAVCGTSIGAINGALVAQGDFELAKKLWLEMTPENIYNYDSNIIDRFRDLSKLREILEENISEEKIRKSDIDYGLVTINLSTFKPIIIFKDEIPKGKMIDYILASSNYPTFYREKIDDEYYIDGGLFDNLPSKPLFERGFKHIIEVDIDHPITMYGQMLFGQTMEKDKAEIHTIRTKHNLHGKLMFSKDTILENIKKGLFDTKLYNKDYVSTRFYIKDFAKDDKLNIINIDDMRHLIKNINTHIEKKRIKECFIQINEYYSKDKPSPEYIPFRSKEFFLTMLEITAEICGIDKIKEYTFEEFIKTIYNTLLEIKNNVTIENITSGNITNITELFINNVTFDSKLLLSLLFILSNKIALMQSVIFITMPKIIIAYITFFIIENKMKIMEK